MSRTELPLPSASSTRWKAYEAPYTRHARNTISLAWTITGAAMPALVGGLIVFGYRCAMIVSLCTLTALLADRLLGFFSRRADIMGTGHAIMVGLLLGMTLPPTVGWGIPVTGALIAVLLGKGLLGGHGNYLWSPVLVGRVGLQLLDPNAMLPEFWPILGAGRLFFGNAHNAVAAPAFFSWRHASLPEGADAWLAPRIDSALSCLRDGVLGSGSQSMPVRRIEDTAQLVFDVLPPWGDTLLGLVGGGIGETYIVFILLGGLYLVHRGIVRWQLPVSLLAGAALTALVFPVASGWDESGNVVARTWFVGTTLQGNMPVGLLYVLFHLTAGELVFAAFFIASDMVTTPMLARGQLVFGFAVGVLAIVLRMFGVNPGATYWAILILSPFVPLIDRLSRRRVMGASAAILKARCAP